MNKRLIELDFLRGVAILLVLLRHIPLFEFTTMMGWIGVDLFFVLSGFLVSGLLFKEYIKFGNINPKLFLIRRGFKIYPIYFIFYLPYLALMIYNHKFNWIGFSSDMTFTQNYIWQWGYAYAASWSLAVEEHFYFLLTILLWYIVKYRPTYFNSNKFAWIMFSIIIFCILNRIYFNLYQNTFDEVRLFTMTHLRMDSLLCGVLIAYFYYFKQDQLKLFFNKYKPALLILIIAGLSWTPFIEPVTSIFVKTIGFTMLYISFGILLLLFLLSEHITTILNTIVSKPIVYGISKIGFSSYSIYIIHTLILHALIFLPIYILDHNPILYFIIASGLSIGIGIVMTLVIEKYFLSLRNRYFPSRI